MPLKIYARPIKWPPTGTEALLAVNVSYRDLTIHKVPNWTRFGNDNFGENCAVFFLAAKDRNRGATEIASSLLESSIFENCWPVKLAGRIGLEAALARHHD